MKSLVVYALIPLLTACAGSVTKSYVLPEELGYLPNLNQLACRFEKQTVVDNQPQKANWYFWRSDKRTETRDELSNQGEIWEHNKTGQLFYTRLFFNEKIALEFMPGDLAAMGTTPLWRQLNSIVDPDSLGKALAFKNKEQQGKVMVESYAGVINGVDTEVDWLPSLKLPARVVKKLPEGTVTLTLAECGTESKLSIKPLSKTEFDNLRRLDYTDLGDMEDDPMVRHLEQLMGGHHHH